LDDCRERDGIRFLLGTIVRWVLRELFHSTLSGPMQAGGNATGDPDDPGTRALHVHALQQPKDQGMIRSFGDFLRIDGSAAGSHGSPVGKCQEPDLPVSAFPKQAIGGGDTPPLIKRKMAGR
jgi:hypothetical protein